MSINIGSRQDVSYLFSGMNSQSTTESAMGWLGDYASIKNGSYGKLLKAYYSDTLNDTLSSKVKDSADKTVKADQSQKKEELSKVDKNADALKASADVLLKKGKDSVFSKEEESAVYDAVSNFVKEYNQTLTAAAKSSDSTVANRVNNMTNNTSIYAKQLAGIGITVGEDKLLSLDKDAFMKADRTKVQSLFQSNGSFGYQTSAQASLIGNAAESAVSSTGLYSASGNQNYSTGNLFNNFF